MDWTAIAVFIAFIAYTWHRERRDERLWKDRQRESDRVADLRQKEMERVSLERQTNCHEFHRQLNVETGKIFEGVAKALNKYTDAVAEQADRHKTINDLHAALVENENLKAELKELRGPVHKIQT